MLAPPLLTLVVLQYSLPAHQSAVPHLSDGPHPGDPVQHLRCLFFGVYFHTIDLLRDYFRLTCTL